MRKLSERKRKPTAIDVSATYRRNSFATKTPLAAPVWPPHEEPKRQRSLRLYNSTGAFETAKFVQEGHLDELIETTKRSLSKILK